MKIGFTGTQRALSRSQIAWLNTEMAAAAPGELHHGACVGADAMAHGLARVHRMDIVVHPPENRAKEMQLIPDVGITVLPRKPYLVRNRDIVDAVEILWAMPEGREQLRSGTWSTVRYAVACGVGVLIVYPSGAVELR